MRLAVLLVVLLGIVSLACRTNQTPESQVNDLRITTEVKAQLAEKLRLSTVTNVNVTTVNGQVTLTGIVESEQMKKRAEQIARGVNGVSRVNNNLQVKAAGTAGA